MGSIEDMKRVAAPHGSETRPEHVSLTVVGCLHPRVGIGQDGRKHLQRTHVPFGVVRLLAKA